MALIAMTLAFACVSAFADTPAVRAWLDRDTIQVGETVTLNVEAQAGVGTQPDFSALKQDFNLLGTQSSQQISIVNGVSQSKTLWAVGLEPKHEGRVEIPSFAVGKATTAPLQLTVLAQQARAQGKAGDDVFLETSAEPLAPYVQQQVRYTVKLYYAFDLTDGNLNEPQADGVAVQRLGQDKSYIATIGARRYHVVERHYALTPERSGIVEVPALLFRGNALDAGDPTGFFSRGRAVGARSEAVQLNVKPRPAEWTDPTWLPAASLLLKDEGELPGEVRVGDPVTRTIRLQAQGLGYEQLPELALSAPAGAEIYPDKTDTRTRDDGEWLYGERVRKFAFVPNRPGTLTVPGLKVRWWNTAQDRAETAELPPRTITVLPAAAGAPSSAPAAGQVPAAPERATPAPAAAPGPALPSRQASTWPWRMLSALGFGLWLLTLALWWWSRRRASPTTAAPVPSNDASAQRAQFLRSCSLGEFAGAERALIAWARRERPDVRNLGELASRLEPGAQREALADLQRVRYAGGSTQGLAMRLQTAFKSGLAWADRPVRRPREVALPALYPERE
ncbi:BatD family protein [Dokdonella ginsengisoli]|uniref:BatD family protein n=1 Tax=Dokdonella ginsengisoli TaxID=363846 RepID=A0ABV9QZU7_9GAMM